MYSQNRPYCKSAVVNLTIQALIDKLVCSIGIVLNTWYWVRCMFNWISTGRQECRGLQSTEVAISRPQPTPIALSCLVRPCLSPLGIDQSKLWCTSNDVTIMCPKLFTFFNHTHLSNPLSAWTHGTGPLLACIQHQATRAEAPVGAPEVVRHDEKNFLVLEWSVTSK